MYLLISTFSNSHFSAAIGEKSIACFKIVEKEYAQSELLLKTIQHLLADKPINQLTLPVSIRSIFVVQGPGAFSVLRVGISTANALAFALNIPVIGVKLKKEWLALTEEARLEKVWSAAVQLLDNQNTRQPVNQFVSPFYGLKPHITNPNNKK